jgi:hypothetical protein
LGVLFRQLYFGGYHRLIFNKYTANLLNKKNAPQIA